MTSLLLRALSVTKTAHRSAGKVIQHVLAETQVEAGGTKTGI